MKLKEWRVLNDHVVMFDTYTVFNLVLFGFWSVTNAFVTLD